MLLLGGPRQSKIRICASIGSDINKVFLGCYLICPGFVTRPLHTFGPENTSRVGL